MRSSLRSFQLLRLCLGVSERYCAVDPGLVGVMQNFAGDLTVEGFGFGLVIAVDEAWVCHARAGTPMCDSGAISSDASFWRWRR